MKKIMKTLFIGCILVYTLVVNTNIYGVIRVENTSNNTNTTNINSAKLSTPQVNVTEKVYDFANLLTKQQEKDLYNDLMNFINTYNMDMVIVTINENNKSSAMAYADDFYDYNNFGVGSDNSGILFLIDMDNRVMWISTTGKAIEVYTDDRINSILDYTYDKISNNDYYGCASDFIYYAKNYAQKGKSNSSDVELTTINKVLIVIIPSMIITVIFVIVGVMKHRNVKKQQMAKAYINKGSINITTRENKFVSTHTSKVKIETSSSSGGGSSTHIGSSGISHGGGGRSF